MQLYIKAGQRAAMITHGQQMSMLRTAVWGDPSSFKDMIQSTNGE